MELVQDWVRSVKLCVCVRARQDVREAGQKQDDTSEEKARRVSPTGAVM